MLKEDDFVGRMMEEEVYRELYDAVLPFARPLS